MFRLEIVVDDDTGRRTFIIFDKDEKNMTNTLAVEIVSIEVIMFLYLANRSTIH